MEITRGIKRSLFLFFLFLLNSESRGWAQVEDKILSPGQGKECVLLLHGLARSKSSMKKMEAGLREAGYSVINVGYPSREEKIEELAERVIPQALKTFKARKAKAIHFVTHSMGGILVRYYLSHHPLKKLGRVVMLSPPNQGSEVVDKLGKVPGFYALNGPAGDQLGTDSDSIPRRLGPVDYEVGIITGNRSINLFLSLLIPGEDDGKVSVEKAKVKGMKDFLVLPHSHPFIMKKEKVIRETIHFLHEGRFLKE